MKIPCRCGAMIFDSTDDLPHKAHLIPDQEWAIILDAISAAVGHAASGAEDAASASRSARLALWNAARTAWQCRECGRLYVDDQQHHAHEFVPADPGSPRTILRSRPTPGAAD